MASTERFAFKWRHYPVIDAGHELQFRRWIHPLTPNAFVGKKILDAGCGIGANSYYALRWGARTVMAFDYDPTTVELARKNLQHFPNATVRYESIYDIHMCDEFDIVMCIGVLHHLDSPSDAMANLVRALRPGGRLIVWVYSREGNEWIVRWVDPIRKQITSRLPLPLLHMLSYGASVPLWAFTKLYRGRNEYFRQLAGFKFWHLASIVFDQLLPAVAHYWRREEVGRLAEHPALDGLTITQPPNRQGWTIHATKRS